MGINDTTVKNLPYNISNLTFINEFKGMYKTKYFNFI